MTLSEIHAAIADLPNVTTTDNFGYRFFCYATDEMRPFVSTIESDNQYDRVSDLNREGVFRLNIGVSKDTFRSLFPEPNNDWDYTELNRFMPHHEYAAANFISVLSPAGDTLQETLKYIAEAHAIAKKRFESQ